MLGNTGFSERSGEIYLPYIGHVSEQTVILRDGSIMAMGHIDGVAFELEDTEVRNARCQAFNTLFRNIADDNISVCVHLVRHGNVPELPARNFRSDFGRRLDEAYRTRTLKGGFYRNDYFFTVVVSPRNALGKFGGKFTSKLSSKGGGRVAAMRGSSENQVAAMVHAVEDLWHVIDGSLEGFGLRRLGLREKNNVVF